MWTDLYNFFCNLDANVIPMVKGSMLTVGALASIAAWIAKKTPSKKDDFLASLPDDLKNLLNRTYGKK